MQLLATVLRETDKLEELLLKLSSAGIGGATVVDCEGMGEILFRSKREEDIPFFGLLSNLLESDGSSAKLIFMILSEEKTEVAKGVIRDVTGGLDAPNHGIMFAVPLVFAEGIRE